MFSDQFLYSLNTIHHFNLKCFVFVGFLQVLNFKFLKFRILEILNIYLNWRIRKQSNFTPKNFDYCDL